MPENRVKKLFLFDIDGTILTAHGIPGKVMQEILTSRFPGFQYDTSYHFSGRTDWEILEHMLGFARVSFNDQLVKSLLDEFESKMSTALKNGKKPELYPGVAELLNQLQGDEDSWLGLVTGNTVRGAEIKLTTVGLWQLFPVGGFGDDAREREDLPPFALKRARNFWNIEFDPAGTWIIGDSIRDVACARANGLRSLAVATGWTGYDVLEKSGAEYLVRDLSNTGDIIKILKS
jgi:phosphoglycolate phosphatase